MKNLNIKRLKKERWFRHKEISEDLRTDIEILTELTADYFIVKTDIRLTDNRQLSYIFPWNNEKNVIEWNNKELIKTLYPECRIETIDILSENSTNPSILVNGKYVFKFMPFIEEELNPEIELLPVISEYKKGIVPEIFSIGKIKEYSLVIIMEYIKKSNEVWEESLEIIRNKDFEAWIDLCSHMGILTSLVHEALIDSFGIKNDFSIEPILKNIDEKKNKLGIKDLNIKKIDKFNTLNHRIHGDLHLGQVLSLENSFICIDFEGEPMIPVKERISFKSPFKDLAGMTRSFDYALLSETGAETSDYENYLNYGREKFLESYIENSKEFKDIALNEISENLRLFELERVLYEIDYERNSRPDWEWIPQTSLKRLKKDY